MKSFKSKLAVTHAPATFGGEFKSQGASKFVVSDSGIRAVPSLFKIEKYKCENGNWKNNDS